MAVVVNLNGNHYYVLRIVSLDGSAFVFENEKTEQELYRGVRDNTSLADTTSSVFDRSIPQKATKSQAQKSTKDLTEKYSSLNLNEDISESDGVPAIRLIDVSALSLSAENGRRMYLIIAKLKFKKF